MHKKVAPPPGFHIRTATMADLPAVFGLATEAETAKLGAPDTVIEDQQEEWDALDLAADAVLAHGDDGNLLSADIWVHKILRAAADPTE